MWLLLFVIYTANPVTDVTNVVLAGEFKTFETCSSARVRVEELAKGLRGVTVRGACVLQ